MKKSNVYMVILLVFLITILLFITNFKKEDDKTPEVEKNKILLLSDYNDFFTVNSSIYKYISYLQKKDYDSILKILDTSYKSSNNITLENVVNFVENLEGNHSFSSKKIYYEVIDDNIIKYYVYGYLSKDTIDGYSERLDRYYIVIFNTEDKIFSIIPSNEIEFKEVTNEQN